MDKESDVIKHQMEHTRSALTDKLELLEHQVTDTVTGAAETVEKVRKTVQDTVSGAADTVAQMQNCIQDTVASVTESVRETAENVSETLDVRKQVEKHPWAMMAGATAVGFGVGILVSRVDVPAAASTVATSARSLARTWNEPSGESNGRAGSTASPFQGAKTREQNGRHHQPEDSRNESPWTPAVNQLKGLAIGSMFGVLRDVLSNSLPDAIKGQVGEVIDNFTTSLGGKPIAGRVFPESHDSHEDRQPQAQNSLRPRQTTMTDIEE